MTIEQYFKDKINWKTYNSIVDACTLLEDYGNVDFLIEISLRYVSMSNNYQYTPIYSKYNGSEGKYEDLSEKEVIDHINYYKKDGFYYVITVYDMVDIEDDVIEKLNKNKHLNLVDKISVMYSEYILQDV